MRPGQPARVSFRIHPISAVVKSGHRLRLSIAGADSAAFDRVPSEGTPTLTIHRGPRDSSVLELPVLPRPR
jgi:predicted acyl esterase